MSGVELRALESCVAAVVSAYKDGATLVRRIKTRRYELKKPVAELETERLEDSLRQGPPVVQAQYDQDIRRFGDAYAQGDQIARDSMKDIIINLQMALITSLHEALQTDLELNYESLLIASDNTRTNAVVCLGQFHQRLATQAQQSGQEEQPAVAHITLNNLPSRHAMQVEIPESPYGTTSPPPPPYNPRSPTHRVELPGSVGRGSVGDSGGAVVPQTARVPTNHEADDRTSPTQKPRRSSSISSTFSFRRRFFSHGPKENDQRIDHGVDHEQHPIGPVNEYSSEQDYRAGNAPEAISPRMIRSPSHSTDPMSFIVSPVDGTMISRGWTHVSGATFYSPDEVTGSNNFWSHAGSDHGTMRAADGSFYGTLNSPPMGPQPDSTQHPPPPPPHDGSSSLIVASPRTRNINNHSSSWNNHARGSTSGTSTTSSTNEGLTSYSSGGGGGGGGSGGTNTVSRSPYMPSPDNKFSGFCKGAWKLQNNMKGAMTAEHRPSGMYGEIRFWKCHKCRFDGPMYGGNSRSTRTFDNQVRVHISGIRYRWVFLAKSHTPQKKEATASDGSGGSFGCIFCCAEWQQEAPVFNDVDKFMEHLQAHREQVLSPELIYRTKCIVGRIAADSEDFDINLPPKAQEMG